MSAASNRIYYFMFGYHHPDAWEAVQKDPSFDCEATGILPIRADDETAALQWGKQLAMWYVSKLYLDYPALAHNLSPKGYACWIETSLPQGCEDCVGQVGEVCVNSYPDFDRLKGAMQD